MIKYKIILKIVAKTGFFRFYLSFICKSFANPFDYSYQYKGLYIEVTILGQYWPGSKLTFIAHLNK